jgi:predicted ribosome quality control (RQC) complex YloA/Tae2 family protein
MLDHDQLQGLADEASAHLAGLSVSDVVAGPLESITLRLRPASAPDLPPRKLLVVLRADVARVARSQLRSDRKRPPEETPFTRSATGLLRDRRLAGIALHPEDRIVEMRFEGGGTITAVAELFGQPGALYLVDEAGVVLAVSHPKPRLVPGARYVRPPARSRAHTATKTPLSATDSDAEIAAAIESAEIESRSQAERRRVMRRLAQLDRLIAGLEQDRAGAARAAAERERADLILARAHELPRGVASARILDFAGQPVDIALDPAQSPVAYAQQLHAKARKLERAVPMIETRLAAARTESDALGATLNELDRRLAAGSEDLLSWLRERALETPTRREQVGPPRRRKQAEPAPRRFRSVEGFEIVVGRDDRENDRLTATAKGNDLWFHVQGSAGSHVIVRLGRGANASTPTLADASLLAVHFSKRRSADRTDVMYTPCKYVRRVRGAPGQVTVARFKTFSSARNDVRLKELLEQGGQPTP